MVRPRRLRRVCFCPRITRFGPKNLSLCSCGKIDLTLDELESLRLSDVEGADQIKAAKMMKISQSTFQRTLKSARKKVSQSLIEGKFIQIERGNVSIPGFARKGRKEGTLAAGPGGVCVCTNNNCSCEVSHQRGDACYEKKCPECGAAMRRKS